MTEFTIAAGLLEVASVGITLTRTLHDLGTTAREAGQHTDLLAKNISHHCRALKDLSRQIKTDNPDHSAEALELAKELQEQSTLVLKKIRRLLPRSRRDDDGLSFKQRLQWAFRKRRVAYLVGQLEYLKSTTTLLFHILSTVPNIRKYKRSKEKPSDLREEITEELTQAQNLLHERYQAQQNLPELAADDAADDEVGETRSIEVPDIRSSSPTPPYSLEDMAPHPGNCLAQIDAYANELIGNESGALTWQKTTSWLTQLYGQWTTLSLDGNDPTTGTLSEEDSSEFAMLAISDIDTSQSSNSKDFQKGENSLQTGSEAKAAQVPPLEPTNDVGSLYSQRTVTFGGGSRYGNIVAHLTRSNITRQLNKIGREIRHLKGQKFSSDKSIHKRLCELEFREMLLEAEHKVQELWPLQSAYLEKINSELRHYSDEMNAALGFRERYRYDRPRVPRIQAKLAWLRLVREEYMVKASDIDLEIWPITPFSETAYY